MSASQKWDLLKGTLKSAAETTIGRSVPRHKNPHCQDMAALSETQRKLRLQTNNTRNPARKQELKQQRNRILHAQRRRARDNASVRLDHLASEVERLHDGAKMFREVQEMTRKPASKLRIQDDSGRVICNAAELNERVTHHFGQQFNDPRVMELPAFTGVPSPLTMPITPGEVQRAISKLNSGRACGHDDLPADLLKSTADLIAPAIAEIFNDALEHHEPLDIGKGVLILLQKPGKPVGPLTSVRPIVLLSALQKTLSLVVLSRIATKVDNFLSPSQSGFRRGRSTADVVFGYRWLCAKAQRQRVTRISMHRPKSRFRHHPPRQAPRGTAVFPRRARITRDPLPPRCHITWATLIHRRVSRLRLHDWNPTRRQLESCAVYSLPRSSPPRPSFTPSA